mgnify:FL=1
MKIKITCALGAFLLVALLAPFSLAHETEAPHEESAEATSTIPGITFEDLGVTKTGLLPTNPFYFVKEWERKVRLLIAASPIKRADLELKITNEKAAELKKVAENNPENKEALERAIDNYNKGVDRLRVRLEALQETSNNPNIDELLERLTDRTAKHQQLFEELIAKHQKVGEKLKQTQSKVDEMLNQVPEELGNPDIKSRLLKVREKAKERVEKKDGADAVACTMDAKLCSDGSYVGRIPPACEFAACPEGGD